MAAPDGFATFLFACVRRPRFVVDPPEPSPPCADPRLSRRRLDGYYMGFLSPWRCVCAVRARSWYRGSMSRYYPAPGSVTCASLVRVRSHVCAYE